MSYYVRHDLLCLLEVKGIEKRNWSEAMHFEGEKKLPRESVGKTMLKECVCLE